MKCGGVYVVDTDADGDDDDEEDGWSTRSAGADIRRLVVGGGLVGECWDMARKRVGVDLPNRLSGIVPAPLMVCHPVVVSQPATLLLYI